MSQISDPIIHYAYRLHPMPQSLVYFYLYIVISYYRTLPLAYKTCSYSSQCSLAYYYLWFGYTISFIGIQYLMVCLYGITLCDQQYNVLSPCLACDLKSSISLVLCLH